MTEILTTHLSATDAWHQTHSCTVSWIPEEITGYDVGRANRDYAHDTVEDPPAFLLKSRATGNVYLRTAVSSRQGTTTEFQRVDDVDDLDEGTFWTDWGHGCDDDAAEAAAKELLRQAADVLRHGTDEEIREMLERGDLNDRLPWQRGDGTVDAETLDTHWLWAWWPAGANSGFPSAWLNWDDDPEEGLTATWVYGDDQLGCRFLHEVEGQEEAVSLNTIGRDALVQ